MSPRIPRVAPEIAQDDMEGETRLSAYLILTDALEAAETRCLRPPYSGCFIEVHSEDRLGLTIPYEAVGWLAAIMRAGAAVVAKQHPPLPPVLQGQIDIEGHVHDGE